MNGPIIEISDIGKKYRIGALREPYLSLRDSIARKSAHFWNVVRRREAKRHSQDDFWALRNVSFSVNQGDAIGIIGRNGAGKSTLLKILSQITPPTEGRITCRGRIASLLEVGTGFHPELTGRENIYLNGAILGMTRSEIRRKFDDIVAFAEMEKFLDTPVKRYSSGMYVRLAFAVAAHLEPEILIIDEVLAVGDVQFQKKCLGKMGEVARQGRTILFVSHNMGAVVQLCSRGVVLSQGRVTYSGPSQDAIEYYIKQDSTFKNIFTTPIRKDRDVQIREVETISCNALKDDPLSQSQSFGCIITYDVKRWPMNSYVALNIYDNMNNCLLWSCDIQSHEEMIVRRDPGTYQATVVVPDRVLLPGSYSILVAIYSPSEGVHDVIEERVSFEVTDRGSLLSRLGIQRSPALTSIPLSWSTEKVREACEGQKEYH